MEESREITWRAPEFKYENKDISWYWFSIIVAAILVLISLWQKNLLFGIFVILAETMVIFWARQSPKNIDFKIDKEGIAVGKINFYYYEDLEGFHLKGDDERFGELILKTKNKVNPYLKIILFHDDIPRVKDFLSDYLQEIEYEESLTDSVSKIIGF